MGEPNESEALRRQLEEFQTAQKQNVDSSVKEVAAIYPEGKKNAASLEDAQKTVQQFETAVDTAKKAKLDVADFVSGGLEKAKAIAQKFQDNEQALMTKAKSKMAEPGVASKMYEDAKTEMGAAKAEQEEVKIEQTLAETVKQLSVKIEALVPVYEKALQDVKQKQEDRDKKYSAVREMEMRAMAASKEIDNPQLRELFEQFQNKKVSFKEIKSKLELSRSDLGMFSGKKKAAHDTLIEYAQKIEDSQNAEKVFTETYNSVRSPHWEGFKPLVTEIEKEKEKLKQEEKRLGEVSGKGEHYYSFKSGFINGIRLNFKSDDKQSQERKIFQYNLDELLQSIQYR